MLNLISAIHGTGAAAGGATSYESIATYTAAGGETSFTFSSIPSTYKHLQIRFLARSTTTGTTVGDNLYVNFNSDTGSNYVYHQLLGDGATATSGSGTAQTRVNMQNAMPRAGVTASVFSVSIIDILDYASTSKNKTVRSIYGTDVNGTEGKIYLESALWLSTSAISTIAVAPQSNGFAAGSKFALYGIKG